jgi:hypothetical protein
VKRLNKKGWLRLAWTLNDWIMHEVLMMICDFSSELEEMVCVKCIQSSNRQDLLVESM